MRLLVVAGALASVDAFSLRTAPVRTSIARAPQLRPIYATAAVTPEEVVPDTAPASTISLVEEEKEDKLFETLKTGSFFALWYLFNIVNQIYNKKALNALPIPYSMATLQLFVGIPYCFFLWATGLRKAPKLSTENVKTLIPISLCHLGTHLGAVVSLGAGAVSFTHIIKASEPVVSAALSFVLLGAVSSWQTYLTLLPIVGGVALASLKELSFTWVGFIAAMLSNVSSALRAVFSKKTMTGKPVGKNMGEANLYSVLSILAFIACVPISLAVEPPAAVFNAIAGARAAGHSASYLWTCSILSGFFFYLYNEVAFLALGRVNPVTHAVGNTLKRVVIIVASVIAFKTPVSMLGVIGSSIAISGTLLYSLAKSKFG
jgi:solute carrier family 35 protein E1